MIVLECYMERRGRHSEYNQLFHDRVSALAVLPETFSAFVVKGLSGLNPTDTGK